MTKVLALAASIALTVTLAPSLAAQVKLDVRFGILAVAAAGDTRFVETTRVPNIVGQRYGWVATIVPATEPITWTEELRLPRAARVWPDTRDKSVAVTDDRTAAQKRGILRAGEREFSHFWVVAPEDPSGRYSIVVKLSDGVVANFAFDVVDASLP